MPGSYPEESIQQEFICYIYSEVKTFRLLSACVVWSVWHCCSYSKSSLLLLLLLLLFLLLLL